MQPTASTVWVIGSPCGLLEGATQRIIVGQAGHAGIAGAPLIAHWR